MPIERAVPEIVRKAASMDAAFMSEIFCFARSLPWGFVTCPTLVLFGSFEPLPGFFVVASPAAFLSSTLAGGVFKMKLKLRSENTVMTTGIIMSPPWVFALNSLQNCMMFTPCWPSAGPTGGAGLALPAGSCSLICPVTFFMGFYHSRRARYGQGPFALGGRAARPEGLRLGGVS